MSDSQVNQRLAELIARIAKLPSADLEPPQFFANYLQLTVAATGSAGGAIWVIQPSQGPQCYCHIELELAQMELPAQRALVSEAVQRCASDAKPLVVPAAGSEAAPETAVAGVGTNQCGYPLFFKPLSAAKQVAMVLQLIGSPEASAAHLRAIIGLLDQIAEYAETYLAHRRAAVLDDDRKALALLLQYTEAVHATLDPEKVIYQLANMGRDALGCTRTVVWIDPQVKRGLRAVSGVDKPDRRAVLLQAIEKLSRHCIALKKPIVAARGQLGGLEEQDELTPLLKNYFNVSQLDQIFLQTIEAERGILGVFIAEGFDEQATTNLSGIMAALAKHGGMALANALEMASMPLMRPLARLQKVAQDPKRRRKWLKVAAAVFVVLLLAAFMPWTIRIKAPCELVPTTRRFIDSPLDGVQVREVLVTGGAVIRGQLIVQLDDLELLSTRNEVQAQLNSATIEYEQAEDSGMPDAPLLNQRVKIFKSQIERLNLRIKKCRLTAPIDGTILTAQRAMEELQGRTLAKGDAICEIADLGRWQVVMRVPQEEIAWVHRRLADEGPAKVSFYLAAYPEDRLSAEILDTQQISQMPRIDSQGNSFEVRIDVAETELEPMMSGLRDGSIGRAKIDTVKRPLGYVLLRKVIRFFRVTFF